METAKHSDVHVRNVQQNSIILFENQTLIFNSTSLDVKNLTTEEMECLIIFLSSVRNWHNCDQFSCVFCNLLFISLVRSICAHSQIGQAQHGGILTLLQHNMDMSDL